MQIISGGSASRCGGYPAIHPSEVLRPTHPAANTPLRQLHPERPAIYPWNEHTEPRPEAAHHPDASFLIHPQKYNFFP